MFENIIFTEKKTLELLVFKPIIKYLLWFKAAFDEDTITIYVPKIKIKKSVYIFKILMHMKLKSINYMKFNTVPKLLI